MAMTDQEIQRLQGVTTKWAKLGEGDLVKIDSRDDSFYKIIHTQNDTTQAIAVAPVKYDANGEEYVDYSQTAIVVAGTRNDSNLNLDVWKARIRAGVSRGGMTEQYHEIASFYKLTAEKIRGNRGAKISNMSGFSQAGPPVAKVAAENGVEHITNFMDWGGMGATRGFGSIALLMLKEPNDFTDEELNYINEHAHIYSDYGKEVTNADGGGGVIPYGKVFTVEGAEHSPSFPKIRENGPDYEYYAKEGKFVTGMNERQVYQAALHKVKAGEYKHDVSYYIKEYKDKYGSYAKIVSYTQDITANRQKLENLRGQLSTATGAGLIFVRKELVKLAVDTAYLQTAEFENAFFQKMKEMKLKIQAENRLATEGAYAIAYELNGFEVDSLLEDISFRKMWDEAKELVCMEELTQFSITLNSDAEKLMEAANKLEETDKEGANLFAKSE